MRHREVPRRLRMPVVTALIYPDAVAVAVASRDDLNIAKREITTFDQTIRIRDAL